MARKKEISEIDDMMLRIMTLRALGWQQPEIAEEIGMAQSSVSEKLAQLRTMNIDPQRVEIKVR